MSAGKIASAVADGGDELSQKLGACDAEYFASGEAIADRLFEYIKQKADEIILPVKTA